MTDPRDDLAALTDWAGSLPDCDALQDMLIAHYRADGLHCACGWAGDAHTMSHAKHTAEQIIAAGWVFDGSCRDCQANLDTNGGQHMFHCRTDEGKAQWAEEGDEWPTATT